MTVSAFETKPRSNSATAASNEAVSATVTGVDVKGQMFRRPASILMLNGRDCIFRTDCEPESNGSVLLELDFKSADPRHQVLHASVKSTENDTDGGFYKVVVELEVAQSAKILLKQAEPQPEIVKAVPLSPEPDSAQSAESKGAPVLVRPVPPSAAPSSDISQASSRPNNDEAGATLSRESRDPLPKTQSENPIALREAVKAAVASEIKQELSLLKNWISAELGKTLPGIVSSNMERMIREAIDKQASVNSQASAQAINASVARQMEDRMAELRTGLEASTKKLIEEQVGLSRTGADHDAQESSSRAATVLQSFEESAAEITKKLFEQQSELSRTAADRVNQELGSRAATILQSFEESAAEITKRLFEQQSELSRTAADCVNQELSSRAATILQSFEESADEMHRRINASRAAAEGILTKSQALQQEISEGMLPLQQALRQLNDANLAGIENFRSQAASEITRCSALFEDHLKRVSNESAVEFSMDIERRLVPNQQIAAELLEKLGAVFQLLQSTARVQQERMTEHSKATAANFEKEIRSVLLRLAGVA